MPSSVRSRPIAERWKTRSVYVRLARYVSRWRVAAGSSCGARRLVADEVDDVEALRELDEGDVVVEVARRAGREPGRARSAGRRRGRTRPRRRRRRAAASGLRGVTVKRRGADATACATTSRGIRVEAGLVVDERPRRAERGSRRSAHQLDADLLEQLERGLVHRLDLVVAQERDRSERVPRRRPGEERADAPRGAELRALPASAPAARPLNLQPRLHSMRRRRPRQAAAPGVSSRTRRSSSSPQAATARGRDARIDDRRVGPEAS